MIAVADIGNTRIKLAAFKDAEHFQLYTGAHGDLDELAEELFTEHEIDQLIISSTADEDLDLTPLYAFNAQVSLLGPHTPLPLTLDYSTSTLGNDRVADAVAALRYSSKMVLVIDMGTCITYNHVVNGVFIGGGISPGWRMRHEAMHHFTGRLPLVEPRPTEAIPNATEAALQDGAYRGIWHETQGIIHEFRSQYPEAQVVFTGGDTKVFLPRDENHIFADPFHTLKGLHDILLYQNS